MPPLPENGPTIETAILDLDPKGLDDSPVPSANSREEETAEATEEERSHSLWLPRSLNEGRFDWHLRLQVLLPRIRT